MCLHCKSFENNERKGEIACNEQFLLFPQCFLPIWRTVCHFHQTCNCCLQTLSVWKSPKYVVWEMAPRFHILSFSFVASLRIWKIQKIWSLWVFGKVFIQSDCLTGKKKSLTIQKTEENLLTNLWLERRHWPIRKLEIYVFLKLK